MAGQERLVKELSEELHALSQPLTTLRFRLDMAVMLGDEASLKEMARSGLEDVEMIFASMSRLRERLAEEVSRSSGRADG